MPTTRTMSRVSAAVLAIATVALLALGQTLTSAVALLAAGTVYILKGTNSAVNQVPDSAYPQFAHDYDAAVGAPAPLPVESPYPYDVLAIPSAFWPITPPDYATSPTFDESVAQGVAILEAARPVNSTEPADVIWGYSQGAVIATQYKRDYNAAYATSPTAPVPPTFVLVANPNRPNGGILERGFGFGTIPLLGTTFSGATPTTTAGATGVTTYDIARQYDGIADAPVNPLNVLADLNALMGFYYLHGHYVDIDPSDPQTGLIDQGVYGDTHYYLIPSYPLPLLIPLTMIAVIGYPLADALDPALRVIVESTYDRSTPPGVPTPMDMTYAPDPAALARDLLSAVAVGADNGISDLTGGTRPLGTVRPGPFGVGGPSAAPATAASTAATLTDSMIPALRSALNAESSTVPAHPGKHRNHRPSPHPASTLGVPGAGQPVNDAARNRAAATSQP